MSAGTEGLLDELEALAYEWRNWGVTLKGQHPRGVSEAEDMCAAHLEAVLAKQKVES